MAKWIVAAVIIVAAWFVWSRYGATIAGKFQAS